MKFSSAILLLSALVATSIAQDTTTDSATDLTTSTKAGKGGGAKTTATDAAATDTGAAATDTATAATTKAAGGAGGAATDTATATTTKAAGGAGGGTKSNSTATAKSSGVAKGTGGGGTGTKGNSTATGSAGQPIVTVSDATHGIRGVGLSSGGGVTLDTRETLPQDTPLKPTRHISEPSGPAPLKRVPPSKNGWSKERKSQKTI
ncbi:hypothetical protein QBC46DRAFT_406914 [Diplogelasinospora grovesii]|uniref:Uncharacterized protein n=1 Tax=Diplogelasinospora grovesii TaxID=303347 RepID=A0AAN6N9X1_9PEZI|nr:hypothetical protein QBC46DRAFT_406914 [Diplogelasinospora grovesii]